MRVVAITEPGRMEVVERPDPRATEALVLVRITSIPIGTEFKGYAAGRTGDPRPAAAGSAGVSSERGRLAGTRTVTLSYF